MKNKNLRNRIKNKRIREKILNMFDAEDSHEKIEKYVTEELSEEDVPLILEIIREARLNDLFKDLNIDEDELKKVKRKVIKLSPKSSEFPLISELYRNHKGNYKVEDLMNEYHDSILRDGMIIGMDYGKKFIVEDLQSKRFSKNDIKKMSKNQINEYCDEIREEI